MGLELVKWGWARKKQRQKKFRHSHFIVASTLLCPFTPVLPLPLNLLDEIPHWQRHRSARGRAGHIQASSKCTSPSVPRAHYLRDLRHECLCDRVGVERVRGVLGNSAQGLCIRRLHDLVHDFKQCLVGRKGGRLVAVIQHQPLEQFYPSPQLPVHLSTFRQFGARGLGPTCFRITRAPACT